MFELSIEWLTIIVNASVRALFMAVIAYAALRFLKLRDANMRHRVWSGVLLGMLCLPVLSGLLPPVPLPFELGTDWRLALEESPVPPEETPPAVINSNAERLPNPNNVELLGSGNRPASLDDAPGPPWPGSEDPAAVHASVVDTAGASSPTEAEEPVTAVAPGFSTARLVRTSLTAAFAVWLLGMAVLLVRTVVGLLATHILLRRSQNLQNHLPSEFSAAVLKAFQNGRVRLMCSDEVRVPVTVGWWKPTVLLPTSWQDWSTSKMEAVLAHETTHVARRDFVVAVLAEVNRCLYWFHPMSWWLRRTLSDLAEEACDDAAIDLTGNPAGYARHLLEVAAALTHGRGRVVQPGLSMARESIVVSRIASILDFTRPLSRQLTWKALAVLLLVTVPVIALSAALQPAGPVPDDQSDVAETTFDNKANEDSKTKEPAAPEGLHIHGKVVDNDKRGIANAKVQLFRTKRSGYYAANPVSTLVEDLTVDSDGHFDSVIPLVKLPKDASDKQWANQDWLMLVVSAPGRVYATHSFPEYGETEPLTFGPPDDVPMKGRLLSLEGQPVSGVTVSVIRCERGDSEKVDAWLARVSKNPPKPEAEPGMMIGNVAEEDRFPSKRNLKLPLEAVPTTTSDENGRFQINGFGADDLILVEVSGGGVVKSTLHVLGRDLQNKKITAGHRSNLSSVGAYYGREFRYVTQPSVPVFGVIRDIDTKKPLTNVDVAVGHVSGRTYSHTGYVVTKTDEQGRYRIDGLPAVPKGSRKRDRNSLSIRPGELPYIEHDSWAIPLRDGLDPIEFNIELRKAVLARGQLTNRKTGEPIQAKIYYSPFRTNDHCADYVRFADQTTMMLGNESRYQTDRNGYFYVPVIEGRGVIAAKALGGSHCTQYGVEDIPEFNDGAYKDGGPVTSDHIVPSLYHSLKAVDVPTDVDEIKVDMQVDPGLSLTAKFIDPNGKPLTNVEVSGAPGYRGWVKTETDSTTISSLVVGQVRPIWATLDGPNRISRMIQLVPEEGQKEFTIQLFDRTVVTGRLIDVDGNPIANQSLAARHNNDPEFINTVHPNQTTDADGKFQYYLVVGTNYTIIGQGANYFTVAKDLDVSKPQRIDLGDLVVDPDAKHCVVLNAYR